MQNNLCHLLVETGSGQGLFFDENTLEEMFSQSRNHQAFVLAGHLR